MDNKNAKSKAINSTDTSNSSAPTAGTLAQKIKTVFVRDLKPGDQVLYPGNKVIPVGRVDCYSLNDGGLIQDDILYVITFKDQPDNTAKLAFLPSQEIMIYAP